MMRGIKTLVILLALVLIGGGFLFAIDTPAGASDAEAAAKYKCAEPGESFTVGMITWWLGQEYAIMVYQATEQAAKQMGLSWKGAVASTESDYIEMTESMIASGAKIIIYNVPNMAVMKQIADIANQNHVFIGTYFGYTADIFPGDFGPYWVLDNTPFSDEQTYIPLTCLMQKMRDAKKTKLLIHQASKSAATVSTVYINLGVFQALQHYPEMKLAGFQYGEWGFEPGRAAGEASLAVSKDYQGMWGANDGQTMGALKALGDRGLNIGAYSASRDMELTTAQKIMKGDFLCTSGFAIPYFGGRLVPMLYDMAVGAWYPTPDEYLQTGTLDLYGRPGDLEKLAKEAGIDKHPSFHTGPLQANMEKVLSQMKAKPPNYPYDFRTMSLSKVKELGLKYDRHGGGGTYLGSHNYYFPAKTKKFGSTKALRAHLKALYTYFLDISWMTDLKAAKEYAKQFPPELKVEPNWQ